MTYRNLDGQKGGRAGGVEGTGNGEHDEGRQGQKTSQQAQVTQVRLRKGIGGRKGQGGEDDNGRQGQKTSQQTQVAQVCLQ